MFSWHALVSYITAFKDMHTICDVILWELNEIMYGKHFAQCLAHRKQLTNISYLYYSSLLTSGNPHSAKELGRKHLLTILEIITVTFFTASEESNKKNSIITMEIWGNKHTKDLQMHFNYPKRLEAERETHIPFPAVSIRFKYFSVSVSKSWL